VLSVLPAAVVAAKSVLIVLLFGLAAVSAVLGAALLNRLPVASAKRWS